MAGVKTSILVFFVTLFLGGAAEGNSSPFLFKNNKEGYNMYRIPAIVKTNRGKLLAFCEGRNSLLDHGDIDLVMKISADGGQSWSPLQVVWNEGSNTCGNPSPVVDALTGDVVVLATLNNDKVIVIRSTDEGAHWQPPQDITAAVKLPGWKWYATGPVHAIQLSGKAHKNRLVVPCNHTLAKNSNHVSHIIYSDDGGYTWQLGGSASAEKTDECTVAELANGNLILNMRNNDRPLPNRKICFSADGGLTWSAPVFDSTLVEPVCQGALLRYSILPDILLFANPAHIKKRKNLTLRISYDGGISWAKQVVINGRLAAYCDMVVLPDGDLLCIFETGKLLPYGGIVFKEVQGSALK